jgi:hypothetical protein
MATSTGTGMFSSSGSTDRTQAFLKKMQAGDLFVGLESLAQIGVNALASMTPVDTGLTAASWGYEIAIEGSSKVTISWTNYNRESGALVAVLLQYGHGTGTGGFVSGYDYINPAIQPVFEQIAEEVWRRVTAA